MDGGIFGLLGLIRLHRGAVEYDLRHRFGLGLRDIGDRVTIAEVARLVVILRADPSSAIAAALEGWDYPISREALILADIWDVEVGVNWDRKQGSPPRHWMRPYKIDDRQKRKYGDTGGRSRAEVAEILNRLGHEIPA